jgi:hypothetical protein
MMGFSMIHRRFNHSLSASAAVLGTLFVCLTSSPLRAAMSKGAEATGDEPNFHSQPLFEAGRDNYRCYRIPAIAVAPNGAILAAAAGRYNGHGDWSNTDLMLRRSTDGGETWDEQQVLVNDGVNTVDNPCFIVDAKRGEVHLMYQIGYARAYLKTSRDDGVTWSPPQEVTAAFDEFRTRDGYKWQVIAMASRCVRVDSSYRCGWRPIRSIVRRSLRPSTATTREKRGMPAK